MATTTKNKVQFFLCQTCIILLYFIFSVFRFTSKATIVLAIVLAFSNTSTFGFSAIQYFMLTAGQVCFMMAAVDLIRVLNVESIKAAQAAGIKLPTTISR